MTIYLLKNSPHNEDFLLDYGYAVDDEGIRQMAIRYVSSYFLAEDVCVVIDHGAKTVTAKWDDGEKRFHLVAMQQLV